MKIIYFLFISRSIILRASLILLFSNCEGETALLKKPPSFFPGHLADPSRIPLSSVSEGEVGQSQVLGRGCQDRVQPYCIESCKLDTWWLGLGSQDPLPLHKIR